MAKRNRSSRRPQPRHKKQKKSQHDKRSRLDHPNPRRKRTTASKIPLTGAMQTAVGALQAVMDRRIAFRLAIIVAGMFLADDRRTASAWFVAGGVQDDWDRFYDCLKTVGRTAGSLGATVLGLIVQKLAPTLGDRILLGMDDSPTSRYGRYVEGAGVHHNPTPGPADGEWLYGHNWVCLGWLARHPSWGVIALPLRSSLYVREVDVPKLVEKYGSWDFRTKHQLGVALLAWFMQNIRAYGTKAKVWLVVDGAYAVRPFLLAVLEMHIVVVSRLRKDAYLRDLPPEGSHGNRIYGHNRISLAKRAGHRKGWDTITYDCRGVEVTRQYKTFLATTRLISGQIRVVILRLEDGTWAPYFCTDTSATVRDILEAVAARWALEEHFHDVKEVWGAGEQQVRSVWSNIGCWNLNSWVYTLVELCCWNEAKSDISDRSDRSWDNAARRPSHADRRRTIAREMLRKQILPALPNTLNTDHFRMLIEHVISLAA
jgi:hypothetical protein